MIDPYRRQSHQEPSQQHSANYQQTHNNNGGHQYVSVKCGNKWNSAATTNLPINRNNVRGNNSNSSNNHSNNSSELQCNVVSQSNVNMRMRAYERTLQYVEQCQNNNNNNANANNVVSSTTVPVFSPNPISNLNPSTPCCSQTVPSCKDRSLRLAIFVFRLGKLLFYSYRSCSLVVNVFFSITEPLPAIL